MTFLLNPQLSYKKSFYIGFFLIILFIFRMFFFPDSAFYIAENTSAIRLIITLWVFLFWLFVTTKLLYDLLSGNSVTKFTAFVEFTVKKYVYQPITVFGEYLLKFNLVNIIVRHILIPQLEHADLFFLFFFILPRIFLVYVMYYNVCVLHCMLLATSFMYFTLGFVVGKLYIGICRLQLEKDNLQTSHSMAAINLLSSLMATVPFRIFVLITQGILCYVWYCYLIILL